MVVVEADEQVVVVPAQAEVVVLWPWPGRVEGQECHQVGP